MRAERKGLAGRLSTAPTGRDEETLHEPCSCKPISRVNRNSRSGYGRYSYQRGLAPHEHIRRHRATSEAKERAAASREVHTCHTEGSLRKKGTWKRGSTVADRKMSKAAAKKTEYKDGYRLLADTMREKKGVDYANAKLEGPDGDGEIIEFVRGKDLARYLRAHPEKMEGLVQPVRPGEETSIRFMHGCSAWMHLMHLAAAESTACHAQVGQLRTRSGTSCTSSFTVSADIF